MQILAYGLIAVGSMGLAAGLFAYSQLPPSPYPEEVTKHVRKALYYEGAGGDPKQAIQYYLQAIEEATKLNLDQTSDSITGLKIKVGSVYENSGRADSALRVYNGLLSELKGALTDTSLTLETKTRLLRRAIGTSVKVGDLALAVTQARSSAETAYVWALETFLKETANRKGDSSWLELDTIGALYEAVARFYDVDERPHLSLPLYLKALESFPEPTCHTITIMNNIAASMSAQSAADQVQENAARWATKARDLVITMRASDASECDIGRSTASYNLGTISKNRRRVNEAREHYQKALSTSLRLSNSEGREIAAMSTAALRDLEGDAIEVMH